MALNLNKEISLDTIKGLLPGKKGGAPAASTVYPTKTTMNLYQGDEQSMDVRKLVIFGVVFVLALGLFIKFGVFDQFGRLTKKQVELERQQDLVVEASGVSGAYASVKEEYDSYTAQYGTPSVDSILVLEMVDQLVRPVASVSAIVLSDGTLTLTLQNVPLTTVGDLAKTLEEQPLVSSVHVSTATTQNAEGQNTVSTLIVTLVSVSSEE